MSSFVLVALYCVTFLFYHWARKKHEEHLVRKELSEIRRMRVVVGYKK